MCSHQNLVMSKAGSEVILKCLMGKEDEIDIDALPWGPDDERTPLGIETVIAAETIRPARGRILEEVLIKREDGNPTRVVLDQIGGEKIPEVVEIKEEPVD